MRHGTQVSHVYFNPRSHERSDPSLFVWYHNVCYFNPRSHERSDSTATAYLDSPSISIHAPTRGATLWHKARCTLIRISIHAPTRGATASSFYKLKSNFYFNPRSHERSDKALQIVRATQAVISIHAPTRGATRARNT